MKTLTRAADLPTAGAAEADRCACQDPNQVAMLIPCHRARRGDGSPGGYACGPERKAKLLEKEGYRGDPVAAGQQ